MCVLWVILNNVDCQNVVSVEHVCLTNSSSSVAIITHIDNPAGLPEASSRVYVWRPWEWSLMGKVVRKRLCDERHLPYLLSSSPTGCQGSKVRSAFGSSSLEGSMWQQWCYTLEPLRDPPAPYSNPGYWVAAVFGCGQRLNPQPTKDSCHEWNFFHHYGDWTFSLEQILIYSSHLVVRSLSHKRQQSTMVYTPHIGCVHTKLCPLGILSVAFSFNTQNRHILTDFRALRIITEQSRSLLHEAAYNGVQGVCQTYIFELYVIKVLYLLYLLHWLPLKWPLICSVSW